MKPWATIAGALARHGRCAMVTVADTQGSAPREAGARMIVMPDGGFHGTIGGGALEWRALADARTLLAEDAPQARLRRQALGPELGQCCGGSVRLLIEVFDATMADEVADLSAREAGGNFATVARLPQSGGTLARNILEMPSSRMPVEISADGAIFENFARQARPLYLFGAGHVGRSLVLALAPLPFEVTWIDPRREAFPAATPGNVRSIHLPDPVAALAGAPRQAFVLVMTHSHALDLALVHVALEAERFAYVGLIGSATKRARFRKRLSDLRLSADSIAQLVCPIGLAGIASKAPAAIAASVAADLLIRHEAVEHGKEAVAQLAERA
jgi:xanthine dehydrogenase accessory factor